MSSTAFHVMLADWQRDRDDLRHVREIVFVREQRVPVELEWDGLDDRCDHVLARDREDQPIGTGRLTPGHSIGRMAVLAAWRGHGVGAAMLTALIERARQRGWAQVTLHAQVDAIGFYQRFGFACHGDEFVEAGIRHRHMTLKLMSPGKESR
ncbi:MAG TPA: GNAT family N-acetyltransferase [Rhodanobacteraceae bacterium]|nr:GNAT family N-acetyltransferase [Rhodanobacteraceae bacterium]